MSVKFTDMAHTVKHNEQQIYGMFIFIEHIQYQGNVLLVNTVTCVYMCECVVCECEVGVFSNKYV